MTGDYNIPPVKKVMTGGPCLNVLHALVIISIYHISNVHNFNQCHGLSTILHGKMLTAIEQCGDVCGIVY